MSALLKLSFSQKVLRNTYSVYSGTHDTACIACALSAWVESLYRGLQILSAYNTHRGGGTAFNCGKHRVGKSKALDFSVDKGDCFPERICNKFGEKLYITSAYRTADEQQALYDEKGSSVAQRPGESEHQTGLAADVAIKGFGGASILKTDAGKYINLHCWNYGFIIRYPDGRKDVTGINYEPWHIRYVGAPHAEYICKNDITLEEYVESLTQNMLFTYDKLPQYAVIKTDGHGDIVVPENYVSCIISPDNCGNYIITFQLY